MRTGDRFRSDRRSWVDRLIDAIDRLPGPAWLFYVVGTLLLIAIGTGITWIDGSQPVGTFDFVRVFNDGTALYQLGFIQYLQYSGLRALATCAPALGDLAVERPLLEHRLSTMPPLLAALAIPIGAAASLQFLLIEPGGVGLRQDSSLALWIFAVVVGMPSAILLAALVLFVLRQLVIIARIHRRSTAVSIFDPRAHGAFARLTLPSSIGLALPVYVFSLYQLIAGNPSGAITAPEIVLVVAMVGGAVAVFIVPLWGIHRRLVRQRAELLGAVTARIGAAADDVHRWADGDRTRPLDESETLLSALATERDVLKRLSTWPWEGDTLRALVSSIALPILIWLTTTLLGRVLGE